MHRAAITGTGVHTPSQTITNDELVSAFDAGDRGLICSFGAGYSVGSVLVTKR